MQLVQILIIVFAVFALSRAFLRFRDKKLTVGGFLFWLGLWAAVIFFSFIPSTISQFSMLFGINRGVDLMMYVSVIVLFYLIFRLYVKAENQQKEITSIVRKLAIDKEEKRRKGRR